MGKGRASTTKEDIAVLKEHTKYIKEGLGEVKTTVHDIKSSVDQIVLDQAEQGARINNHDLEIGALKEKVDTYDWKRIASIVGIVLAVFATVVYAVLQLYS